MNNFLKAFLVVFFLCGFPLIFIGITLHYVLDLEQKKLETALFSRIDLKLAKFQTFSSQETFLRSFLTSFGKRSDKNGLSNDHLIKKIKNVNKEFPLLFSFILFDRSGELIYQDISNNSEWISKKLLFLLRKYYQSGEDHFQGYFPVLSNFIGCSVKRVQRILERPDLIETSSKPQKSWFFYYLGTNFSFFAHIHRVGYPPMMPLRKAIQRPPKDGIIISLVDMGSKQVYSLGDEKVKVLIENVAFRFEQEPRVHLSENGRLWSSIILDSRFRLIASSLDETFKTTGRLKRVFYLSVILVLLFSFWTVLTFLKRTSIPYISLRWKLLVLFLLSSGLPLLILAFTVMVYLDQRTQSLKQDAWVQSGEILRAFDSKFPVALRDCQAALQKILSETNLNLSGGLKNLEARIKEFRTNYKCSTFKLMSNATDSFLLSDARKEAQSGKIFQTIMLNVLRQLNGETEKNSNNMLALETDLFLSSFVGQEMSDLIDNILLSLGTIFKMDLALNSWYVFIDTIKDKNGFSSHIFAVTWDRVDIVGYYLRKCFPFKPLEDGTELFAIDTNPVWVKEMVPGTNSSTFKRRFRCFPRKPVSKSFRRFIQSLLKNRRVSQDLLVYKKVNFLATGVPGKLLENLILVALKPESPIRHEIDFLRSRLLLFGLFSLGFTSFLGIFLAKKFLGPINELANGVVAVKEKKFAFRLPNQDPDELGDLSALFNNMMESLYEVSMGREVQEKLFPKKKLCVGEYQVFGLSKPATELGGDYFDYLPIGDRGLLVLIGDVTGHGVPAALVMAMSKAVVTSQGFSGATAVKILETLNQVIFQTIRPQLLMTLGLLFIDTVSNEIQLFNCGHPYPKKVDASGKVLEITPLPGIPIGLWNKLKVNPTPVVLNPNERIIFFTDGLAESLDQDSSISAYDLLDEYFQSRPSLPIERSCGDILENHPFFKRGLPQPDDFTVVIVERKSIRVHMGE